MKILIAAFLLSAISACSGSNNNGSPMVATTTSPLSAHQQLLQSLSDYENSNTVVTGVFGAVTPPTFSNPTLEQMAQDLKTCKFTSDGNNGGTLSGTSCPITFTLTETVATTGLTTSMAYKVVNATFQTYSPVSSFTVTTNDTYLGTNLGGSISLNIAATTTNESNFNANESIVVSATNSSGEYTVTFQATVTSPGDNANLNASITAHNDSHGVPTVDSETCTVDGTSVNCSAIGTFSKIVSKLDSLGKRH